MLGRPRRRLAQVDVIGHVSPGWEIGEGRQRARVTGVTTDGEIGLAFVPGGAGAGETFGDGEARIEIRRIIGDTLEVPGHGMAAHPPRETEQRQDRQAGEDARDRGQGGRDGCEEQEGSERRDDAPKHGGDDEPPRRRGAKRAHASDGRAEEGEGAEGHPGLVVVEEERGDGQTDPERGGQRCGDADRPRARSPERRRDR